MTDPADVSVTTHQLETEAPFAGMAVVDFLRRRAVLGVESVDPDGTYRRGLLLPGGPAAIALSPAADHLDARIALSDHGDLPLAIRLCRRLFDLDAAPSLIDPHLSSDPLLRDVVAALPGRRSPGAIDGAEIVVRAIVGQQVSVVGARTILGRLATAHGEPLPAAIVAVVGLGAPDPVDRLFPAAGVLAELDPTGLPMPRSRAEALVTAMSRISDGSLSVGPDTDPAEVKAGLLAVPGIGPWTASYVAMRALGDPDVFLATDVAVKRALTKAGVEADPRSAARRAERWRPWRSYALHHLWAAS